MLIISRSSGESLLIGESKLAVQGLVPSVRLVLIEGSQLKEFEFSLREVASNPSIVLKDARVTVQRIQRGRLVLAIDAPRSVPVLKGEAQLPGDAAEG